MGKISSIELPIIPSEKICQSVFNCNFSIQTAQLFLHACFYFPLTKQEVVGVVLVSEGYPEAYQKGYVIERLR